MKTNETTADQDRLERIEGLLHQALSMPPSQRSSFLKKKCAHDADLCREVESLLAHADEADTRFERSALDRTPISALRASLDGPSAVGETVGRYRLLERIGSGGMGDVYRAVRDGDDFEQIVAVKLIRRGLDTEEILSRFRQERRVLSALNHPNIAGLIDGGTTDDGRPFLVMELVAGTRIDRFCDDARLAVRQRIELFRIVCDAVQFAHRKLVVHRDLKPGNILVSDEGRGLSGRKGDRESGIGNRQSVAGSRVPFAAPAPYLVKIIDFGIAKVLSGDDAEHQCEHTATFGRRLTPAIASPEQIRGEVVTTATDLYSLGALLYRLLTGRSPYAADPSSTQQLERAICDDPPRRPSVALMSDGPATGSREPATDCRFPLPDSHDPGSREPGIGNRPRRTAHRLPVPNSRLPTPPDEIARLRSTDTQRLRRELSSDLETILLTALNKEPERRYATAAALSDDLRRYLDGRPIAARPDTWLYRAARFITRNRMAVIAVAGVFSVVFIASIVSTVLAVRLGRQTEQLTVAVDERQTALDEARREFHRANAGSSLLIKTIDGLADEDEQVRQAIIAQLSERSRRMDDPSLQLTIESEIATRQMIAMVARTVGALDLALEQNLRVIDLAEGLPRESRVLAEAWGQIGRVHMEQQQPEEAIVALRRAHEIDTLFADSRELNFSDLQLIEALLLTGEADEARAVLRERNMPQPPLDVWLATVIKDLEDRFDVTLQSPSNDH